MPDRLGDYIRELREGNDEFRSLRQFADALGKSPSWVSKVERNLEVPGTDTLLLISQLLGANSDELLKRADKLDPEVEKALIERYTEVSGLLRTIKDMSPQQIDRLKAEAEVIREEGERERELSPSSHSRQKRRAQIPAPEQPLEILFVRVDKHEKQFLEDEAERRQIKPDDLIRELIRAGMTAGKEKSTSEQEK